MRPFLHLFGREIPVYSTLGIFGLVLAVFVAGFRAKRYGVSRSDLVYAGTFAGIGLFLGGRLLFILTQIPLLWQYREFLMGNPEALLGIFAGGGMVFYGGLFGALGTLYFYCRLMRMPFDRIIALAVPVIPLAHAVMRVGCFMAGCCYGIPVPASWWGGVADSTFILNVQLFEAFGNLLLFCGLWWYTRKDRDWVTTLCLYGISYGVMRFFLEFLRGDVARGFAFGLSTSQWISLGVVGLCVGHLLYRRLYWQPQ